MAKYFHNQSLAYSIKSPEYSLIKSVALYLLMALAVIAMLSFVSEAQAQGEIDNGDLIDDRGQAPDNSDSDHVPGLGIGYPDYAGSGCPNGTVTAAISPDQRTLPVMFDRYVSEAGGNTGVVNHVADCRLNIPFQVPPGYRVQIVKLDYRGFTAVPPGGRSTVATGFRFLEVGGVPAPGKRVMRAKVFSGPRQEDFALTSQLQSAPWSPCGQSFTLQAESRINVQTNPQREQVITAIDSVDGSITPEPVVYHLRWKPCHDLGRPPGARPNPPPPGHGPRPVRPPRPPRGLGHGRF